MDICCTSDVLPGFTLIYCCIQNTAILQRERTCPSGVSPCMLAACRACCVTSQVGTWDLRLIICVVFLFDPQVGTHLYLGGASLVHPSASVPGTASGVGVEAAPGLQVAGPNSSNGQPINSSSNDLANSDSPAPQQPGMGPGSQTQVQQSQQKRRTPAWWVHLT